MRIGIVNDVPMIAEGIARIIRKTELHEIAWIAYSGEQAVAMAVDDPADIILMDLIMPGMDGADATFQIMQRKPCPILVVTSSVNENIALVFRAMGNGAIDAISTPILTMHGSGRDTEILLRKIETVVMAAKTSLKQLDQKKKQALEVPKTSAQGLVAVGASAGGPRAIASLLEHFKADIPVAVVVVQHINRQFAPRFADWLNTRVDWPVQIAHGGDVIEAGRVYLAVTNNHLVVSCSGHLVYHTEPIDMPYRPSVNVFFESVVTNWSLPACGLLLSGLGVDGVTGLKAMRDAGHYTMAEDKSSAMVYEMPKIAKEKKAAIDILPVEQMGQAIHQYFVQKLGLSKA